MLIKLTGADFSADNIGRVQVLHSLTKKVFANQTRFSIDSPQGIALNNFFWAVDSLGINISSFVSPWLANDISEAVYDSVSDTGSTPPSGYTITEGLLVASANGQFINMPTTVSPRNWFIVLRDGKKDLNGIISNNSTANIYEMTSKSYIGKRVFTSQDEAYWADNNLYYTLYEINSLTNLQSEGSLYINGINPTVGSSVTDTINSDYMNRFAPSFSPQNVTRMIYICGDGNTILTAEQRTSLIAAASELVNILISNESI